MIAKIPINYYPLLNSGHTLKMAGKIDPWRMYYNKAIYRIVDIGVFPDFTFDSGIYTDYILFEGNGTIDYSVLTSLN